MEPINIPENLSDASVSDDALVELAQAINDRVTQLSEDLTTENVEQMEQLGTAYASINDEMVRREGEKAELAARADAVKLSVAPTETASFSDDGEAEEAEEVEAEEEAEEVEAEEEAEEAEELAVEAEELAVDRPRSTTLAQRLSSRRSPAIEPTIESPGPLAAVLKATQFAPDVREGAELDMKRLAEVVTRKRLRFGNIPQGIHDDRITIATAEMPYDSINRRLDADAVGNFTMLREVRDEVTTLVASGGVCAPFAPRYDIFRTATPHSPVEDNLPVLGAPRGGIRFVVPPDFRDARAGIGTVTCEEDEAGYGSGSGEATPKPCVHLECPQIEECCVTAVSHCIEFGNLQFQVFPEWVEGRMADLMVEFASVKEVLYLDVLDAESIAATTGAGDGYGAFRRMLNDVRVGAVGYRRRNGMDENAMLDWYAPGWVPAMMAADAVNDNSLGLSFSDLTYAAIEARFRALGVNPVWYYDSATGEGQAMTDAQAAAGLNAYPTDVVSYLFSPGTFIRLDGGSLDVGLVRDSVLNRTNDLQIFAEQWVQVCKLGIESIKITHEDVCANGAAPEGDTLITC